MNTISLRALVARAFGHFDIPLLVITLALMGVGFLTIFSATYDSQNRLMSQLMNMSVAFTVMWAVSQISPQTLARFAPPLYFVGVVLLVLVEAVGVTVNGAQRWLDIGVTRIQPSEIMKISVPLMLAWYFHKYEEHVRLRHFLAAAVLLLIPVALIIKEPDLGTAILVASAGFFVIFFAGLSWKIMIGLLVALLSALPFLWTMLHDYQRRRVMTLLDPTSDPLGAGYHIIQGTIAIGSGGILGKGWLQGTQTHLEFIPEKHTDFIFAVFSEEWGLLGNLVLLFLYALLIGRGLYIASNAPTTFSRLLAGAITLIFFMYAFVNMGMVSGILPVVGVPLPFVSYGGTAMVTMGLGLGMLMSIARSRQLVPR